MYSQHVRISRFTDSFNFEKMYSYSSFFNVFVFGGPKMKRIRILRDIDISQQYVKCKTGKRVFLVENLEWKMT